eukprot:9968242-Lingulodinium_polyedra.AAC.1
MRSNRPIAAATACKSHTSHTPCKHQKLVFAWRAQRARFANRSNGEWLFRMHFCVALFKRYTKMRSTPPFAATAA